MNRKTPLLKRVFLFYKDGFSNMTVGRSLWLLILIKLAVIFLVLKLFFFHDFVGEKSESSGASPDNIVRSELMKRTTE